MKQNFLILLHNWCFFQNKSKLQIKVNPSGIIQRCSSAHLVPPHQQSGVQNQNEFAWADACWQFPLPSVALFCNSKTEVE